METNISTVQVVLMGLITVFVVLIRLIVIIKILGLIMEKVAKKQPAPAAARPPQHLLQHPLRRYPPKTTSRSLPLSQSRSPRDGTDVSHIRIHSIKRSLKCAKREI